MLSAASPSYLHVLQTLALVLTSVLFLPLSIFILFIGYALHPRLFLRYSAYPVHQFRLIDRSLKSSANLQNGDDHVKKPAQSGVKQTTATKRCTILVTGVGMAKGLHIARAFHLAHHRVIGADCYNIIPPIGKFSRSIEQFYALPLPADDERSDQYIHALVDIIQRENVSLWVSCSGVSTALDDARAKEIVNLHAPSCGCVQFDVQTTQLLHEKDSFIAHATSLGLPVPETHTVTTRAAVHKILNESPRTKKRYVMKSLNLDDASRGEIGTLLPRRDLSETYNHLARLPVSEKNPWVLQQYIAGNREYCTHSLVIRGKVKIFVACPSSELLMHYQALHHPDEALSKAMLRFTEKFAQKCQQERADNGQEFTGHLSFDFLIEEQVTERGVENVLRAIECNPRAHTAVVLFRGKQSGEMVQAYLSILGPDNSKEEKEPVTINGNYNVNGSTSDLTDRVEGHRTPVHPSSTTLPVYWLGHDLVSLILHPLVRLFHPSHPTSLRTIMNNIHTFLDHLIHYRDGAYETWDPLPAFILYHIYWPGILLSSLITGKRWSRVNVSTGKVFRC